ncbi:MAG: hypothetical protein KDH09_17770, partial [Chrysiogenetes bacterium]|nr:hypothetical protein [Chrysiogenetes bacterium]
MPRENESPAARWRALIADDRVWWSVLAISFVVTAAVSSQLGGYTDDLFHAQVGRDYSWWELASFKAGPYGMAMGVWKLAVALAPARPWVPVLLLSALLHVLIVAMIAPLLEHVMERPAAR